MSECYAQLTLADRRRLHHLLARKVPINEMAWDLIFDRREITAENSSYERFSFRGAVTSA
ncbi:unnamed protein product [Ciceribacter sp. T2.26MG-112.2]|uniref:hypothetical protein n=1 Tax=Ciceribacter sp. T2.26MG-112.2 TaxID=3137154 RepID=UPI000E134DF3|nr:hypothetical protein [Ciceribacter naphthalenivorans]SSC70012.1 unnamed protein product [Ciceribacter naphthalenivorans]SSX47373.1 unnamed protein product [Ciceribacter naphthalenivorans]